MRGSVQRLARTGPVVDMEFGERQFGQLKETWPADTLDPVTDAFPVLGVPKGHKREQSAVGPINPALAGGVFTVSEWDAA